MLRRSTKFQLILFVVITLLGISYVGAEYVGLDKYVTGDDGCVIHADFPDSGGIFTNAEVTYRGVTVGKVGPLHLIAKGVRVDLQLDNCSSPKIPASAAAAIANRSVVGEQYVNLVPPNGRAPYVRGRGDHPDEPQPHPDRDPDAAAQPRPAGQVGATWTTCARPCTSCASRWTNRGDDLGRLLDATNALLRRPASRRTWTRRSR